MSADTKVLEPSWMKVMGDEFEKPYWQKLQAFLAEERANEEIFPPEEDVFNAFWYTPFDDVRVVILGQDPYHDNDQAHGLCFSVRRGITVPPSLRNMYKEINAQLGLPVPSHGELTHWAKQGVLLLNTVLTVRAHQANSHRKQGWEKFTDRVIEVLNAEKEGVVFVLWGGPAKKKAKKIDGDRHLILESGHPSPLSVAYFRGNGHFTRINEYLEGRGEVPIDWSVPE
jgi:uracil-DNA glycosylase